MDPHSAIHQGQVYSILVHVPYLYFLHPTAASSSPFPPPHLLTSPLPSPVPACLPLFLPVLPSGPSSSSPFPLFFSSSSSLFCHSFSYSSPSCCSSDPTSLTIALPVPQRHPLPHISAAPEANKKPTAPKEDRYSCSLLKRVFCPPLLILLLLWIAPNGLSSSFLSLSLFHFLLIFFLHVSLFFSLCFSTLSSSSVLFHFVFLPPSVFFLQCH